MLFVILIGILIIIVEPLIELDQDVVLLLLVVELHLDLILLNEHF